MAQDDSSPPPEEPRCDQDSYDENGEEDKETLEAQEVEGVFACRPRVNSGRLALDQHRIYEPYLGAMRGRSLRMLDETILRYAASGGEQESTSNPAPSAPPASVSSSDTEARGGRRHHQHHHASPYRRERLCEEENGYYRRDNEEECKHSPRAMYGGEEGEEDDQSIMTSEEEVAPMEGTQHSGFFPPVNMRVKRSARRPVSTSALYQQEEEGNGGEDVYRHSTSKRMGKKAKTYHARTTPDRDGGEGTSNSDSSSVKSWPGFGALANLGIRQSSLPPRMSVRGYTMVDWLDAYLPRMSEEERTSRAAVYLGDAINQRPPRHRKLGLSKIWAYRMTKETWWVRVLLFIVTLHLLLAIWEPPKGLAERQSYFYSPSPFSHISSSEPQRLLGLEFLIVLAYMVDVGFEIYALGITDYFGPGSHSMVVPGARVKASIRAARWGQLKFLLVVLFFADVVAAMDGKVGVRFSRYFRPLYLVCCCEPLRRWSSVVTKTVCKLRDLVLCVGIVLCLSSLLGLVLFSEASYYTALPFQNFKTFLNSFTALYVLITTQNYSQLLYPAYNSDPAHNSELFFFFFSGFVVIFVLFLSNMALPKIYWTLKVEQRRQALESRLLERFALLLSFRCLDSDKRGYIDQQQFRDVLKSYRSDLFDSQSGYEKDVYTGVTDWMYEKMAKQQPGEVTMEEYFSVCEVVMTKFDPAVPPLPQEVLAPAWSQRERARFRDLFQSRWAEAISLTTLLLSLFFLSFYGSPSIDNDRLRDFSYFMIFAFSGEVALRLWAFGPKLYFAKPENILDTILMSAALLTCMIYFCSPSGSAIKQSKVAANAGLVFLILRGVRLFPKFEMFHKFGAAFKVFPFFLNSTALAILFLYFWAILGMQLFAFKSHDAQNLRNASFDNFWGSVVALFQVASTRDWHEVMYTWMGICNSWWTSLYFLFFHMVSVVIMFQLTTALFIDAFLSFDGKRWVEDSDNRLPDVIGDDEASDLGGSKGDDALVTDTLRKRFEVEYAEERRGPPTNSRPAFASVV